MSHLLRNEESIMLTLVLKLYEDKAYETVHDSVKVAISSTSFFVK